MNEEPRSEHLPRDVCSCFMTKTMQLNTEYRQSDFEKRLAADTAIFHCMVTMDCQGPDDEDVMPETCRPGRVCHVTETDVV